MRRLPVQQTLESREGLLVLSGAVHLMSHRLEGVGQDACSASNPNKALTMLLTELYSCGWGQSYMR